jgi:hypothetical protein
LVSSHFLKIAFPIQSSSVTPDFCLILLSDKESESCFDRFLFCLVARYFERFVHQLVVNNYVRSHAITSPDVYKMHPLYTSKGQKTIISTREACPPNAELTDFLPWQWARQRPIDRAKSQVERLVRAAQPSGPSVRPDGQLRERDLDRHVFLRPVQDFCSGWSETT